MAMNNSNYGYPPSGYSSPYSSTPSGMRTQRPRFGYSGPSLYPRPRSSASKPNPDSFSDSMINNYGNSSARIDASFNSEDGNSYNDSYIHNSSSNYYSANDTFYADQSRGDAPLLPSESSLLRSETGLLRDSSMMYGDTGVMHGSTGLMRGDKSMTYGDTQNSGILPNPPSQFGSSKYLYNSSFVNNVGDYKGSYQKKFSSQSFDFADKNNKLSFTARKFGKAKRKMATKQQTNWRCDLCSLDFTSQIPYDMHVRGARHAKKLKAKEALTAVQSKAVVGPDGEKSFFCELCNVKANSSLQLQTHLEGSKHKNKLQPKESKDQVQKNTTEEKANTDASVNGKTNGSVTRPLPSDFGEPQPAKLTKFACDVCSITVNSEIQLQQHLSSKKHQNKIEGKPIVRKRKNKMENKDASDTNTDTMAEPEANSSEQQVSSETSKTVVGVKTLASSFVQGGTLQ